jgi:hypothetical protein
MICDIIAKLVIEEDTILDPADVHWIYNSQYRLCTTNKEKIRELSPLRTVMEEEVYRNQTLILLPQKKIFFHESYLGPNIYLENNCTTAVKSGSDELQLVFADSFFKSGKHYVEFIFETEPAEKSILVGLSLSRNDYYFNIGDPRSFWGFIPSECLKIGYNEKNVIEKKEYGTNCKIHDSVGMLLEFHLKGVDVSFFINKINMGIAFKQLPLHTYHPCVALGFDSSRVRIINDASFPDM